MNSHWLQPNPSNHGMTTVIVMMAILALSIAGASLLLAQKNSYSAVQKIESQDIQYDVSDVCVRKAVDDLKAKILNNPQPPDANVVITISDLAAFFSATQLFSAALSSAAISSFKQYTQNTSISCSYKFVKQRPMTGTTSVGEVTQDRAYQTTGNENVYVINAVACNGSTTANCKTIRTETNIYMGIQ